MFSISFTKIIFYLTSGMLGPAFSGCGVWASHYVGSLVAGHGSRHGGFSSFGTWAQQLQLVGSGVRLRSCGTQAPQHMGSSWTRERTHVPPHWQADS